MRLFFWWLNWWMTCSASNSVSLWTCIKASPDMRSCNCHCRAQIVLETQHSAVRAIWRGCRYSHHNTISTMTVVYMLEYRSGLISWIIECVWFLWDIHHLLYCFPEIHCSSSRFPGMSSLNTSYSWAILSGVIYMYQLFWCDVGLLSHVAVLSH